MTTKLNAMLADRIDLGSELTIFRVVPNDWQIPDFKPGQFATLGLFGNAPRYPSSLPEKETPPPDKLIRRAYSIASSPLNKDYLEFYLVLVKEGVLTPRLWNLKVGDPLFLGEKITGQFTMDAVPKDQHLVFVATGTGLAPYLSMLHTYLKADQKRKFAVFHGVRVSQDLSYRSELVALGRICPNFSYFPIISRPQLDPIPWKKPTGHVQNLWQLKLVQQNWGFSPTPSNTHFFLCGAPAMIEQMIGLLGQEGFTENKKDIPGQIHVERYW